MLRYAVNISMLFKEVAFLDRFAQVAAAGFAAVEFLWPGDVDLDELVRTQEGNGATVALFNVDAGDMAAGERGFPSWPDRIDWWRERFSVALALAGLLRCARLNVLAGNVRADLPREEQLDCLVDNLRWAAPRARAAGVTLMLEALNRFEHPHYLFERTNQVAALIDSLGEPNVKLQYDAYHMQRMEGNIVATLRAQAGHLGHVQIADSPDRHQPGTGELNYEYILGQLATMGYEGYVGLEYIPLGPSANSFDWLPPTERAAS